MERIKAKNALPARMPSVVGEEALPEEVHTTSALTFHTMHGGGVAGGEGRGPGRVAGGEGVDKSRSIT